MPTTPYLLPAPTSRNSNLSESDYKWLLIAQGANPLYEVDTSAGSYSEAVPPAGIATAGQTGQAVRIAFVKTSSDAHSYTLTGVVGGNITISAQYANFQIQSDGTNWWRVTPTSSGAGTVTEVDTAGIATGGPITGSGTVTVLGSGSRKVAATAAANLAGAPSGDVVITDGLGNVQNSGVLLSSLSGGGFATPGANFFFGAGIQWVYGGSWQAGQLAAVDQAVYVFGFNLEIPWTLTTASYVSQNSAASAYYGFGIYSAAGNALITTSFLSSTLVGAPVTNTFSAVPLLEGFYYFAQAVDNTGLSSPSITLPGTGGAFSATEFYQFLNSNSQIIAGIAANPMGTNNGVMPSTLGTISPLTTQTIAMAALKWTP